MSKLVRPSTYDNLKRQLSSEEKFDVFEQVFPRVMQLQDLQFKMQRLAADYGGQAVAFAVGLLERHGVSRTDELSPERRRTFFAVVQRQCELYERENPDHNGECC